jgi:hypothetical protein
MRKFSALLIAAALLAPQLAHASKLYIREYKTITTVGVQPVPIAPEPGADQTPVDFSGGAASSQAFATTTHVVRVICDAACSILFGPSPQSASASNALLGAGAAEYFGVIPGEIVSVHSNP